MVNKSLLYRYLGAITRAVLDSPFLNWGNKLLTNLFPHYPDELALNWFIRYHVISGDRSWRITSKELFGKKEHNPNILYALNLGFFCNQIPSKLKITPDYVINRMTIFPLFKPFMSIERANKVVKGMVDDGFGLNGVIGVNNGDIFLKEGSIIKICKACLKNDEKDCGEAYLHRIHQIPGNFLCIEHNTPLSYFLVKNDKSNYEINMDSFNDSEFETYQIKPNLTKFYFHLGEDIEFVITGALSNFSVDTVRQRYRQRLQEKGYIVDASTNQSRLISETIKSGLILDFKKFYPIDFLEGLESNFEDENRKSWFRWMITGSKIFIHPIRHLLFIRFLFGGTKEFLRYSRDYKPFGDGPYPCLNPVEDHYKKAVIQSCELRGSHAIISPVGVFKCDCGFVYSRKGPDKTEDDRLICGKILQYGHVWESKMKELVDKNFNISYIAREMKCSRSNVIKYASVSGIIDKLNTKQKVMSKQIGNIASESKLDLFKGQITQHIINNPNDSRQQIRAALSKQYSLLGIRDKQWLEGILPQRNKYSVILKKWYEYIDWELRDEELLQKTKHIVILILLEEKPQRITRSLIAHKANDYHGRFNKKNLKNFPKTEEYLLNCCETIEDFRDRRT